MFLSLERLKKSILPPELIGQARFDDRIGPMAAGIAGMFDTHCGRTLARDEAAVETFAGGVGFVALARYPVETVESATLIHPGGETVDISPMIGRVSKHAGIVQFIGPVGSHESEIVIAYRGGFWIDLSEDGDGVCPVGASAIPADIVGAWVLQCDHEARARKIFGSKSSGGTSDKEIGSALPKDYGLLPRVEAVLRQYRRVC